MKKNIINTVLAITLVGIMTIPALTFAEDTQVPETQGASIGGGNSNIVSDSSTFVPDTSEAGIGGGNQNSNPVTGDFVPFTSDGMNGGADQNSNPVTESFVPITDGANTGGADTATPAKPSNDTPTVVSTGGSSSGSSSGGSGRVFFMPTVSTSTGACIYINEYIGTGRNNSASEVLKLQAFLKNIEKLNVDINGNFDAKTVEAVKAFQSKYLNEVMTPWGVSTPSGFVFYTTKNKINEIYCKTPFKLTADQLAFIDSYKKARTSNTATVSTPETTSTVEVVPAENSNASDTTPIIPEIGKSTTETQTAAVTQATSTNKIVKFFKWLFGY